MNHSRIDLSFYQILNFAIIIERFLIKGQGFLDISFLLFAYLITSIKKIGLRYIRSFDLTAVFIKNS